jgi:hypothetical protein
MQPSVLRRSGIQSEPAGAVWMGADRANAVCGSGRIPTTCQCPRALDQDGKLIWKIKVQHTVRDDVIAFFDSIAEQPRSIEAKIA